MILEVKSVKCESSIDADNKEQQQCSVAKVFCN